MSVRISRNLMIVLIGLVFLIALTAFSSALPDGLEWAAAKLGFLSREQEMYHAPLSDYTLHSRLPEAVNQILSAIIGIVVLTGAMVGVQRLFRNRSRNPHER